MKNLSQKIYDLGVEATVDPNFFMAIAFLESHHGTVPSIALSNKNPGSLRNGRGGAIKVANGFAYFDTWEAGIKAFYTHITDFYVRKRNLTTVDEILPVYAPPIENNTVKYIADTKLRMDALRVNR